VMQPAGQRGGGPRSGGAHHRAAVCVVGGRRRRGGPLPLEGRARAQLRRVDGRERLSCHVLNPPLRAAASCPTYMMGTHHAALLPAPCCNTTAHAPSIGQCKGAAHPDSATSTDCACAALLQALQQLRARGYVKGGTADCSIIAHGDRWYDPAQVRFPDDEPSRHKLVDLTVRDTWSTHLSRRLKGGTAGGPAC